MKYLFALSAAFLLFACASTEEEGPRWADVVGREWSVVGGPAPATITFGANGRATGKVLNSYFAGYEQSAGALSFGPVGATRMAGSDADMKRESGFHEALAQVFRWNMSDGQLLLLGQDGAVLLTFESNG